MLANELTNKEYSVFHVLFNIWQIGNDVFFIHINVAFILFEVSSCLETNQTTERLDRVQCWSRCCMLSCAFKYMPLNFSIKYINNNKKKKTICCFNSCVLDCLVLAIDRGISIKFCTSVVNNICTFFRWLGITKQTEMKSSFLLSAVSSSFYLCVCVFISSLCDKNQCKAANIENSQMKSSIETINSFPVCNKFICICVSWYSTWTSFLFHFHSHSSPVKIDSLYFFRLLFSWFLNALTKNLKKKKWRREKQQCENLSFSRL